MNTQSLQEHLTYVSDARRTSAYAAAVNATVREGNVVVDLGCGTGILGLLACRAGAGRVYAVDRSDMLELARRNAACNGLSHRVISVDGLSTQIDLPELADLVMADQMGPFGVDAGIVEYFADARERMLRPDGRLMPSAITIHVAAANLPETWKQVEAWGAPHAGLSFSATADVAHSSVYYPKAPARAIRSDVGDVVSVDLTTAVSSRVSGAGALTVTETGTVHGLLAWFTATLSPGIILTNSPLSSVAIDRCQVFLPLPRPVSVEVGAKLAFELQAVPREECYGWRVSVATTTGHSTTNQSTFGSLGLSKNRLARSHPDARPSLNQQGIARLDVLRQCSEGVALREIERAVLLKHRNFVKTEQGAARFVAGVLDTDVIRAQN